MSNERRYYIPQGGHDFLNWMHNFVEIAGARAGEWDLAPADIAGLKAKAEDFGKKLAKTLGDDATKADIRAKNAARRECLTAFRDYINENVRYNKKINNDGRAALGMHVPAGAKTAIPAPKTRVAFSVRPVNEREHRIDFWDEVTGKKAIPYGYSGVLLFKKVLEPNEAAPIDPSALGESKLLTASPHTETFPPSAQGRRAAYAACWQNGRGERGSLSDVQVHVVP